MNRLSHKTARGISAWVAITAVALNALWPLIAQLKPGMADMQMAGGAMLGMQHAEPGMQHGMLHAAAGEEDSAPAEPSPLMPHCAFCTLATGGFAVLVAHPFNAAPLLVVTKEFRPASREVTPLALHSYSLAHPRAPPVLS
jgi:hypothetical protein